MIPGERAEGLTEDGPVPGFDDEGRLFELPRARDPRLDDRPTHLHDEGASVTRCGIKMTSKKRFPYVRTDFARVHVEGYGMIVCPSCQDAS